MHDGQMGPGGKVIEKQEPRLIRRAVSEETARTVASWADGMITVYQPVDVLRRERDELQATLLALGGRRSSRLNAVLTRTSLSFASR
jgi:nucleotide-binding universal stress UspA family protein